MLWSEVAEIVGRSLLVSGSATLMASGWSLLISLKLLLSKGRVAELAVDLFNTLVSVPTVVIGLLLYLLLSRSGPLGFTSILYTPAAISIGQAILITPFIVSLSISTLRRTGEELWETLVAVGASERQAAATLIRESLPGLLTAFILGFNRAVGELGVALMLGGNIKGLTRVMTTAIALEVSKGEFELALTLGGVLLATTFLITFLVRRMRVEWRLS